MNDLEQVRAALERVMGARVKMVTREEWERKLKRGGERTLLGEPFEPYRGALDAPGFVSVVASGQPWADEGGIHNVRRDDAAPPSRRFKTYSDAVIEDLIADARWPDVLRIAGLTSSPTLEASVRAHVFAYSRRRGDH
jgi:hypothetical protein